MYGKIYALLLILVVACKTGPDKLPEPTMEATTHPDYNKFRPIHIAVLPAECVKGRMAPYVRESVYGGLFGKRYSPFALPIVDSHIDTAGQFSARDLAWDATLKVTVTNWKAVRKGIQVAADGKAELIHSTGTVLWELKFQNKVFESRDPKGGPGEIQGAANIGKMVVAEMPPKPPLDGP